MAIGCGAGRGAFRARARRPDPMMGLVRRDRFMTIKPSTAIPAALPIGTMPILD
jgi:hypothetical protein